MPRILIIGGQNIDITAKGTSYTLHDSNCGDISFGYGGVSGNVAQNLANLGVSSHFISVFSMDPLGQSSKAFYQANNIDVSHSLDVKASSSTYLSLLDEQGDLYIGFNDMTALTHLTPSVLALEKQYINAFDTLFIDTNLSHETLQYLFTQHHHQTIYVDTVSGIKAPKIKPFINYVDVLKCTKEELSLLSDQTLFMDQLDDLINQGLNALIVTNKDQPITYKTATITKTFEPDHIDTIVSSSGAGDAFISGFIYGQLHHKALDTSMAYAIRAASLTLMHPSSVNPSLFLKGENQ